MTGNQENPYESSSQTGAGHGVYRYTELPRVCPACGRKFSEVLYRKLYPRRIRKRTLVFFLVVAFLGFVLAAFIGWLAIIPVLMLGAWGMTFHKVVRVKCSECNWSQKYVVRNRG
jgi:hypothetical protein